MILLRDDRLTARLDPRHGGEILELVDLRSGRQLLGRPPFGSATVHEGELDEAGWTASYRGGWQTALPNFGRACQVNGISHGFHGSASVGCWTVLDRDDVHVALAWRGHGLAVRRTVRLADGAIHVGVELEATGGARVPLMAAEHLALGLELIHPETELAVPATLAYELDEDGGPAQPPPVCPMWPEVLLGDGRVMRAERFGLEVPRSLSCVLNGMPHGWVAVRSRARDQGLALAWDVEFMPHLLLRQEVRSTGGPWRESAELLTIAPATVPHMLGLEASIRAGHGNWLEPGQKATWWVVARPFKADGPVRAVTAQAEIM
jgi:hypothetical protein